jgi:phage gpG-like protein
MPDTTLNIAIKKLDKLGKKIAHGKRDLMRDIGIDISGSVKMRIAAGQFKGLSDITKNIRREGSDNPLNDTGRLRQSITYNATENTAEIGTPLKYGRIHNEGGTIEPVKAEKLAIPANRRIARMSETMGVRKTLEKMEKAGWFLHFTENSIGGTKDNVSELFFIRKKKVTIPKREFLILDSTDRKVIKKIIGDWVKFIV